MLNMRVTVVLALGIILAGCAAPKPKSKTETKTTHPPSHTAAVAPSPAAVDLAARMVWHSRTMEGVTYKFEINPGEQDVWDMTKQDAPPFPPAKAVQAAEKFIAEVPLRADMKGWNLHDIELHRRPGERWFYAVYFWPVLKEQTPGVAMQRFGVPVKFDGTIPEYTVEK